MNPREATIKPAARRRLGHVRGLIEPLEQRVVPASISWTGAASGSWHVGSNWSSGDVPQAGDDVIINPAGDLTITFSTGAVAVRSITMAGDDSLALTGGILSVGSVSSLHDLAFSNGTLTANAALNISGAGSWNNEANLRRDGVGDESQRNHHLRWQSQFAGGVCQPGHDPAWRRVRGL